MSGRNPSVPWTIRSEERKNTTSHGPKFSDTIRLEGISTHDFDEFYIAQWFGMERMDHRDWWIRIGDHVFNAHIAPDGDVTMTYCEGPWNKKLST